MVFTLCRYKSGTALIMKMQGCVLLSHNLRGQGHEPTNQANTRPISSCFSLHLSSSVPSSDLCRRQFRIPSGVAARGIALPRLQPGRIRKSSLRSTVLPPLTSVGGAPKHLILRIDHTHFSVILFSSHYSCPLLQYC